MSKLIEAYANTLLGLIRPVRLQEASDVMTSYDLVGDLYLSHSGWVLLSVPNQVIKSLYDILHVEGADLPYHSDGTLTGHISVIRDDEMDQVDNLELYRFLGQSYTYTLGPVRTVNPDGWDEMDQVWFVECDSPELEAVRQELGLTARPKNNEFHFHITIAVRRSDESYSQTNSR